jgi:hypothetical protein
MPTYVQIIEKKTKKVIHQIECHNERRAVKVERGVHINMNHEDYTTEIAPTPSADCEISK